MFSIFNFRPSDHDPFVICNYVSRFPDSAEWDAVLCSCSPLSMIV